jgi:hypothetical protein
MKSLNAHALMKFQSRIGIIAIVIFSFASLVSANRPATRIEITYADNWYSVHQVNGSVEDWSGRGIESKAVELVDSAVLVKWSRAVDSINLNHYSDNQLDWRVRCVNYRDTIPGDTVLLSWSGLRVIGKGESIDAASIERFVELLRPLLPSSYFDYQGDTGTKEIVVLTHCEPVDQNDENEALSDLLVFVGATSPNLDSSGIVVSYSDTLSACGLLYLKDGRLVGQSEVSLPDEIAEDCWKYFRVNIYADRRLVSKQIR